MVSVRTRILNLPRPITKSITDIAKDLNVSKQYVSKIICDEQISKVIRLKPFCKCCGIRRVSRFERTYCIFCIRIGAYRLIGEEFVCANISCNNIVYRKPSYIKRLKNNKAYCSRKCFHYR